VFFRLAILRSFRTRVDNVSGLLIGTETVEGDGGWDEREVWHGVAFIRPTGILTI
jgi:hypothetical protein